MGLKRTKDFVSEWNEDDCEAGFVPCENILLNRNFTFSVFSLRFFFLFSAS